jgi:glycosyltransferase involved in cell wall biosynthesis
MRTKETWVSQPGGDSGQTALRILQVSTYDTIGGAERVAWNLARSYRARGHDSLLAVGQKLSTDPHVLRLPDQDERGRWGRFWGALETRLDGPQKSGVTTWARRFATAVSEPGRALDRYRGVEDFRFPATWRLLSLTEQPPNIVHCHNLHGGYFDLRALPWLSAQVPVVVTLHDAWLLSGHCAHSFDCERWRTGCGDCPDLTIDPAIRRDATAYNWRRKHEIYENSRLHVATPSEWLMRKVEQSMLMGGVVEARVIPNGVDLAVFHPSDQQPARAELGISNDALVVAFAATDIRRNMWKDFATVREAVGLTAERLTGSTVVFLAMGEDARPERFGSLEVRFLPRSDPGSAARVYAAADVYAHAARADTFPNTVLEALACGIPVVATAVGGIPEQVDDGQTGFLVRTGDAQALSHRLTHLLSDEHLRRRMGMLAVETAQRRFDLARQVDAYLRWYSELVGQRVPERLAATS